jgi:hypothetical protein
MSNDFEQLRRHLPAKRQKGEPSKKNDDLDPSDKQFVADASRLLLPLLLVSSVPSPEARESSPQAGDVCVTLFCVLIQTC